MATFSTLTKAPTAAHVRAAADAVALYRAEGYGSNRGNWPRVESLLAAVLAVCATGVPVELTQFDGYHVAHRALKPAIFSPYWAKVQVVALRNVTREGATITGESDTARGTTVLLCPTQ